LKVTLLARLRGRLGLYTREIQRSREELAESTQEQVLPPIPAGNHPEKRDRHTP